MAHRCPLLGDDSQWEVLHKASYIWEHIVDLEPAAWALVCLGYADTLVGVHLPVSLWHNLMQTTEGHGVDQPDVAGR